MKTNDFFIYIIFFIVIFLSIPMDIRSKQVLFLCEKISFSNLLETLDSDRGP